MIVTGTQATLSTWNTGKTTDNGRQTAAAAAASFTEPVSISTAGRQALAADGANSAIEQYAIPGWLADFGVSLNDKLGTNGNGVADKYPEATAAAQSDRKAYAQGIDRHYRSLLEDNGITDTASHYQNLIVDQAASEKLQQQMLERIKADPALMALLPRMGKAHLVA